MEKKKIYTLKFGNIYPLLVQKAERKNRTKQEVDEIIFWLTGYNREGLDEQIQKNVDYETFFKESPCIHPNASLIKGKICKIAVETIDDPIERNARYLDKLVDELAKGKPMEKILRV